MSENGHAHPAEPPGGRGSLTIRDLMDPHRSRETAGMIVRAMKYGYLDLFGIDYQKTKEAAEKLRDSPDPRIAKAGALLCTMMANHDLKLWEMVDKTNRLDVGDPTERVEHGGALKIIKGVDPDKLLGTR